MKALFSVGREGEIDLPRAGTVVKKRGKRVNGAVTWVLFRILKKKKAWGPPSEGGEGRRIGPGTETLMGEGSKKPTKWAVSRSDGENGIFGRRREGPSLGWQTPTKKERVRETNKKKLTLSADPLPSWGGGFLYPGV